MKRLRLHKTGVLIGLALALTAANGGLLAYSLLRPSVASTKDSTAVIIKSSDVVSTKQHVVDASAQGERLATGSYAVTSLRQSRIDHTILGRLMLVTQKKLGSSFILATDQTFNLDDTNLAAGWTAQNVSDDPLWAPAACSSKPTLILQAKYIFIDDGKTKPSDLYNSYLVYDLASGTYKYFGGSDFTDTQAKHEKVLLATNENDQLVFYIDQNDTSGPLTTSAAFKHARGSEHGYIVRRVIDPATMKFTDYQLKYSAPATAPYYYLSVDAASADKPVTISLDDDTNRYSYDGTVTNNQVAFKEHVVQPLAANQQANGGPYDSALEKQLDGPLTSLLPAFTSAPSYNSQTFTTHFSLSELGQHANLQYLVATSRTGDSNNTPVIYDKSTNAIYPMTTKAFLGFGNDVVLGAL